MCARCITTAGGAGGGCAPRARSTCVACRGVRAHTISAARNCTGRSAMRFLYTAPTQPQRHTTCHTDASRDWARLRVSADADGLRTPLGHEHPAGTMPADGAAHNRPLSATRHHANEHTCRCQAESGPLPPHLCITQRAPFRRARLPQRMHIDSQLAAQRPSHTAPAEHLSRAIWPCTSAKACVRCHTLRART